MYISAYVQVAAREQSKPILPIVKFRLLSNLLPRRDVLCFADDMVSSVANIHTHCGVRFCRLAIYC